MGWINIRDGGIRQFFSGFIRLVVFAMTTGYQQYHGEEEKYGIN